MFVPNGQSLLGNFQYSTKLQRSYFRGSMSTDDNVLTEKEFRGMNRDPENPVKIKADTDPDITSLFLLNFVAIVWGTQHVCIKSSLELYDSTSLVNFWRFSLSTLLFLPAFLSAIVSCAP